MSEGVRKSIIQSEFNENAKLMTSLGLKINEHSRQTFSDC